MLKNMVQNRLREWRKKRGLSQADLARRSGYSLGMIRKLEAGDRKLHERTAARMAQVLACPIGNLFTDLSTVTPGQAADSQQKRVDSPNGESQIEALNQGSEGEKGEDPSSEYDYMAKYVELSDVPTIGALSIQVRKLSGQVDKLTIQIGAMLTQIAAVMTLIGTLAEERNKMEDRLAGRAGENPQPAGKTS
jgi:transcriptional regulator with XRE-family HTH domain